MKGFDCMFEIEALIRDAEKELSIIQPFLKKYGFELDYLKFFQDRLRLPLVYCAEREAS